MAIDNTGISLDAGASDITYTGDEGPRSPQEEQMQMASLVQEYKDYAMQQEEAGRPVMPFEEWVRSMQSPMAGGGIARLGFYQGGGPHRDGPSGDASGGSGEGQGRSGALQQIAKASAQTARPPQLSGSGTAAQAAQFTGVPLGRQQGPVTTGGASPFAYTRPPVMDMKNLITRRRNINPIYPGRDDVTYPWSDKDDESIDSIFAKGPVDLHLPYHGPGQWDYSTFPPVNTPDTPEILNFAFKKGSLLDKKKNQA